MSVSVKHYSPCVQTTQSRKHKSPVAGKVAGGPASPKYSIDLQIRQFINRRLVESVWRLRVGRTLFQIRRPYVFQMLTLLLLKLHFSCFQMLCNGFPMVYFTYPRCLAKWNQCGNIHPPLSTLWYGGKLSLQKQTCLTNVIPAWQTPQISTHSDL